MANTIYSVKGGTIGKLNKVEVNLLEFIISDVFLNAVQIGDSLSEKKLKDKFASWDTDKMTVKLASLITERNAKKVCLAFASAVKAGEIKANVIPVLHENKAHGNYSIDFVDAKTLGNEYSEKELTLKAKKVVDPTQFVIDYLNKHQNDLKLDEIQKAIDLIK